MDQSVVKRRSNQKSENEFLVDMHIHTNYSFDSNLMVEETLSELVDVVDAIVITDHNIIPDLLSVTLQSYEEKFQIRVFTSSVEISTRQGDILAYGISAVPSTNLTPEEIIEIIHKDGGIAIAAHPFTMLGLGEEIYNLNLDAIEVNGSRSKRANDQAKEAAESMGLPCIGGSDSHTIHAIGSYATKFKLQIKTLDDIIEQIKKKNCLPIFLR